MPSVPSDRGVHQNAEEGALAAAIAATPTMLTDEIRGPRAWRRDEIGPRDWIVPLSDACLAELDGVVTRLRRDPLPTLLLQPDDFGLSHCAEAMRRVREKLRSGIGLAVLDRIPVDSYALDENRALLWLLGGLLGRVVPTKWDGTMLYDVQDTGRALEYGVRVSLTNLELKFHTDAAWTDWPPEYVGLYCIDRAERGGLSRFVSLYTVHNELRRRHPDLLPRLYRAYPWERQAEHAPDEAKTSRRPIFWLDGDRWMASYNERLIHRGAALAAESLDAEGAEALAAMDAIVNAPDLCVEFVVERGQVQFIGNRQFAHSRTEFVDAADPSRKRHLIRLWTRDEGRRTFHA
jgi:alpha-ketoglutarate-dependent taurine dioxygenase